MKVANWAHAKCVHQALLLEDCITSRLEKKKLCFQGSAKQKMGHDLELEVTNTGQQPIYELTCSQNCVKPCPMGIPLTRAIYEENRERSCTDCLAF